MTDICCVFSDLTIEFEQQPLFEPLSTKLCRNLSGLTGCNGQGKSVLLKLLSGQLLPSSGRIEWLNAYYYVAQNQLLQGTRIADALGIARLYDSFTRLEQGKATSDDLNNIEDLWHLPGQWQALLTSANLNVSLSDRIDVLSGGQQTRLALYRAFLHIDSYLLLDEPDNHLDLDSKELLEKALRNYKGTLIIVSHDSDFIERLTVNYERVLD